MAESSGPTTTSTVADGDATPDVLVVGGGIGGLSAAYALAREGLRVRVLEQAPEFGEVGAGLQVAPNCTRILHEYGLLEEVKSLGVLPSAMLMRDAVDGSELTRLDLRDLEERYGFPYLVIHRSDLHAVLLRACRELGVDLRTHQRVTGYDTADDRASVTLADGRVEEAELVIAADGLHSVARQWMAGDDLVNSAYVAYRGAIPLADVTREVNLDEVSVHVGPRCHFVQYGLRGGEMLNQVAVFESPKALAGEEDWGTPDELDQAFDDTCDDVRAGIPLMWRDRSWRMFDRDPIDRWVRGRVVLLGDAAHPPLQYLAQGAVMAIEDGWVLARHVTRHRGSTTDTVRSTTDTVDWDAAVRAYEAVRTQHCRRVVLTARSWGELWHLDGTARLRRNVVLRDRAIDDYSFVDWLYGPTALVPEELPPMFQPIPLDAVEAERDQPTLTDA